MVGLASRSSLGNIIVSAAMICWPGRLDRGEALDGTMPKSKKKSHRKATRRDSTGCHALDTGGQGYDKEGTPQCDFGGVIG
jgi:hypothetical protein